MITKADYDELVRLREAEYGDEINYIARDEDGELWGYIQRPIKSLTAYRGEGQWLNVNGSGFQKIEAEGLKFLKWGDVPYDIAAAIAEYEQAQEVNHE